MAEPPVKPRRPLDEFALRRRFAAAGLRQAAARGEWPALRPKSLRLFGLLGLQPRSIAELRAECGGAVNDIREDLEALAYALRVYSPHTLRVVRGCPRRRRRGGSTAHHYWLVPTP